MRIVEGKKWTYFISGQVLPGPRTEVKRLLVQLSVYLTGVFPTEPKMIPDLLQPGPPPYQSVKTLKRISPIFLLKFSPKLIRWLDAKLVAPVADRTYPDIEQARNLCIRECVFLYLPSDKLFSA